MAGASALSASAFASPSARALEARAKSTSDAAPAAGVRKDPPVDVAHRSFAERKPFFPASSS
eukprot:5049316-Alexandrium_andersonii.AAC.1